MTAANDGASAERWRKYFPAPNVVPEATSSLEVLESQARKPITPPTALRAKEAMIRLIKDRFGGDGNLVAQIDKLAVTSEEAVAILAEPDRQPTEEQLASLEASTARGLRFSSRTTRSTSPPRSTPAIGRATLPRTAPGSRRWPPRRARRIERGAYRHRLSGHSNTGHHQSARCPGDRQISKTTRSGPRPASRSISAGNSGTNAPRSTGETCRALCLRARSRS